jgi:predicted nucleic acid-binding protein
VKQRLYLDTSVFGGYFDEEFSAHTIPLFERIESYEFVGLYSEITIEELEYAPEKVRNLQSKFNSINSEFLVLTEEMIELARAYISENVVGKTSFADCLHIAIATVNHADFLVSWNFKHIVNIQRIRGYNSVNVKLGYKQLEIRSPREFEKYGDS